MKKVLNLILLFVVMLLSVNTSYAQKRVAITIDDIPNVRLYQKEKGNMRLLDYLSKEKIPTAAYVNESNIYRLDDYTFSYEAYLKWLTNDIITVGNHTYSHPNYAQVGFDAFVEDVHKGAAISNGILKKMGAEPVKHFRFPYNNLGADSLSQAKIKSYLNSYGYTISPFSVTSEDWMYNALYLDALKKGDEAKAKQIAEDYIKLTIETFAFFEKTLEAQYNREVPQIYLCHDNRLNADVLHIIIDKLKDDGYRFISMDEAMADELYQQPTYFYGSWGISWVYRWMSDIEKRNELMGQQPQDMASYKAYEKMSASK